MPEKKITVKDILNPNLPPAERLVRSYKDLKKLVVLLKNNGYKIVLTQGVWDLIHEGHAKYLERAKSCGDILIVGVDSDELTKKRKGPNRPIVPEAERIRMISHLRHVDLITIRGAKEDVSDLVKLVQPDIFVVSKSTKDFTSKKQHEDSQYCGKLVLLEPQGETSTTARIRNLTIEGVEKLADKIKRLADDFIDGIKNGRE